MVYLINGKISPIFVITLDRHDVEKIRRRLNQVS